MSGLRRAPADQHGMVLISSLLLLVVVTILAVSMFRSFGLDEKIAGNSRDKQLALQAAQSAEQAAENWLQTNISQSPAGQASLANPIPAVNCAGQVTFSLTGTNPVCSNPLASPSTLPWTAGVTYTPLTLGVGNGPTMSAAPVFYIYALSTASAPYLYQIDAVGYGTNPNTVALVEVVYSLICQNCP
jgi:type IV pilus assembly protein PilX